MFSHGEEQEMYHVCWVGVPRIDEENLASFNGNLVLKLKMRQPGIPFLRTQKRPSISENMRELATRGLPHMEKFQSLPDTCR